MKQVEEFNNYVRDNCYDIHGNLDTESFRTALLRYLPLIPDEQKYACYTQLVYLPSKDLRLQHQYTGD